MGRPDILLIQNSGASGGNELKLVRPTSAAFKPVRDVCEAIYQRWSDGMTLINLSREFNTTRASIISIIRGEMSLRAPGKSSGRRKRGPLL